ncbi:MAG: PqqD family protein [Pseudomonadota bacterium]
MSDTHTCYSRNPEILQRELDGEIFLIDDTLGKIHALDPMACGIWRLLEQPITSYDIVAMFSVAFPDRKPKDLRRQVSRLLDDMRQNSLVMHAA